MTGSVDATPTLSPPLDRLAGVLAALRDEDLSGFPGLALAEGQVGLQHAAVTARSAEEVGLEAPGRPSPDLLDAARRLHRAFGIGHPATAARRAAG